MNLYANAGLSDVSLRSLGSLTQLRHVDLCGMQFLTDDALACLAPCTQLRTLNLTWCVLLFLLHSAFKLALIGCEGSSVS